MNVRIHAARGTEPASGTTAPRARVECVVMPRFRVNGTVVGGKYLGEYEAATKEEAIEMAMNEEGYVSFCHQCCEQCENAEIESADAEEITDESQA